MKGDPCKNNSLLKTLSRCLSLVVLSVFGCLSLLSNACSAVAPTYYNARYSFTYGSDQSVQWHYNISNNSEFYISYLFNYQWIIDSVYYQGNYANVHFETNIVMWSPSYYNQDGDFRNLKYLRIDNCWNGNTNIPIKSQSVSYALTNWWGSTSVHSNRDTANTTLTIYGDAVLSDLPSGTTGTLYCGIGLSNGWAFAEENHNDTITGVPIYFEQSPTTIQFSSNINDSLLQQQVDAINNLDQSVQQGDQNIVDAINNQSNSEKQEYQDQASDNETQINSDVSANQQQATTFLNAITTVFNAIKDTPAQNCVVSIPSGFVANSAPISIDLCPSGYSSFITTGWQVFGTSNNFTIRNIFSWIIMVVFLVNVSVSILMALRKIYNLFLGGSDNG